MSNSIPLTTPVAPRRAVIDVGTNSVKLLVVEVAPRGLVPVSEESRQTRLGEGFYSTHVLQPEPIARTAEAVRDFARKAGAQGAGSPRVFATSAARDALNQGDLVNAIRQIAGLELEIISGDQEAEWGYRGVISNPAFAGQRLLIVDLGGGSVQFILGDRGHARFSRSFQLGCVRLLEKFRPAEHPKAEELRLCREYIGEFLRGQVAPVLRPHLEGGQREAVLVATGGTATILARMEAGMEGFDREMIESLRMSRQRVGEWQLRLWGLSLAQRKLIPGLPANRADVILMGTAVYAAVMTTFHLEELRISTRGLRFAAVR